jgi:hypothetical protein
VIQKTGWYSDPYFLGRERFWDGRAWTEQCRITKTKERLRSAVPTPPKDSETATPIATAARTATSVARTKTTTAAKAPRTKDLYVAAAKRPVVTATPPDPATGAKDNRAKDNTEPATEEQPSNAPKATQRQDTAPPAERVSVRTEEAALGTIGLVQVDQNRQIGDRAWKQDWDVTTRRLRRVLIESIAVVAVLVAASTAVLLLRHDGRGSPSGNPVGRAAATTMRMHTAGVTFDVKQAGSQGSSSHAAVTGLSGNGDVNFESASASAASASASASASLSLTLSASPSSVANSGIAGQLVLDGQTLYLNPGAIVGQLAHGKTWISATAGDLGPSTTATPSGFATPPAIFATMIGNPTALLQELKATGVTATSFGSSVYQGTRVEGYAVTLTKKEIDHRLSRLPSSLRDAASEVHPTEDVYVTANGLVRAIVMTATIRTKGLSSTDNVDVVFSNWGGRVQIFAPAPSQVVTWAQFRLELTYTSKVH